MLGPAPVFRPGASGACWSEPHWSSCCAAAGGCSSSFTTTPIPMPWRRAGSCSTSLSRWGWAPGSSTAGDWAAPRTGPWCGCSASRCAVSTGAGCDLRKDDLTALVDTQPGSGNNSYPAGRRTNLVIDHHPARADLDAELLDVRPEVGCCTTMLLEYHLAFGLSLEPGPGHCGHLRDQLGDAGSRPRGDPRRPGGLPAHRSRWSG